MDTYQDWLDARDNAREAIADERNEGQLKAYAEAAYYREKALCVARLKAEGWPATLIQAYVKGDPAVNAKLFEWRMHEAEHHAAKNASTLFIDEEAHTHKEHDRAMGADSGRF